MAGTVAAALSLPLYESTSVREKAAYYLRNAIGH